MLDRRTCAPALLLVMALTAAMPAGAQVDTQTTDSAIAPAPRGASEIATPRLASRSRYQVTQNGPESQFLMNVQVWGQVHKPGLYAVPDDTGIVGLLSYAGGPTESANLSSVRLIHVGSDQQPTAIDLEALVEHGKLDEPGALAPGDVLMVPANRSHRLLRFTSMLTLLTLMANVVVLATR